MDLAPRDETRILIRYITRDSVTQGVLGIKWEECRWVDSLLSTPKPSHWEPWCGRRLTRSDLYINPLDCLCWMHLPEIEY